VKTLNLFSKPATGVLGIKGQQLRVLVFGEHILQLFAAVSLSCCAPAVTVDTAIPWRNAERKMTERTGRGTRGRGCTVRNRGTGRRRGSPPHRLRPRVRKPRCAGAWSAERAADGGARDELVAGGTVCSSEASCQWLRPLWDLKIDRVIFSGEAEPIYSLGRGRVNGSKQEDGADQEGVGGDSSASL
jgi:hypothetical protein